MTVPAAILRAPVDGWVPFGPQHVAVLLVATVLVANLIGFRGAMARVRLDIWLVALMGAVHVAWVTFALASGIAQVGDLLPLYTCDASIVAGIAWCRWKQPWLGQTLFYWSFIGGVVTLLLPDTFGYPLPHPAVLYTLVFHVLLLLLGIEIWAVEGLRPRLRGLVSVVLVTAALVPAALLANARFGSDYMFVSRDPGGIFSFLTGFDGVARVALTLVAGFALLLAGLAVWCAMDRLLRAAGRTRGMQHELSSPAGGPVSL